MKKYTNKILLVTLIVVVVALFVGQTIYVQTFEHKHPEYYFFKSPDKPNTYYSLTCEGDTIWKNDTDTDNVIEINSQKYVFSMDSDTIAERAENDTINL